MTEDFRSRLRPFGITFEKSLRDLINGIRLHKDPESQSKFLESAVAECRKEVKSPDMDLKTTAVLKLCYLEMYGFDMTWANFHVLEVMALPRLQQKRVGYLAASQALKTDNDVLMLATNLLKKDLHSLNSVETGIALSGVSTFVTPALARDLSDDLVALLSHLKPYIRKKTVLTLYKIYLRHPPALLSSFERLCDRLDDPDDLVMGATVTVICELAKKLPKNFVHLSPRLFEILTSTKNNWVKIRLLKLFSLLARIEPRLSLRLLPHILDTMDTTKAMLLVYECVNCIVLGGMLDHSNLDVARLCVDRLMPFITLTDPNLRYVSLLTLNKIARLLHDAVSGLLSVVLECIAHPDMLIRQQALDLLGHVISEDTLEEAVSVMLRELDLVTLQDFQTRLILVSLNVCSADNYAHVADFDWLVSAMLKIARSAARLHCSAAGAAVGAELRAFCVKVPSMRPQAMAHVMLLLSDALIRSGLPSCLPELVWCAGEYAANVSSPESLLVLLLNTCTNASDDVILALVPASMKLLAAVFSNQLYVWNHGEKERAKFLTQKIEEFLAKKSISRNFSIQERACEFLEFVKVLEASIETEEAEENAPVLLSTVLPGFFEGELKPVAKGAQKKISPPSDLDLDTEVFSNDFEAGYDSDSSEGSDFVEYSNPLGEDLNETYQDEKLLEESIREQEENARREREKQREADPFYLEVKPEKEKEKEKKKKKKKKPVVLVEEGTEDTEERKKKKNVLKIDQGVDFDQVLVQEDKGYEVENNEPERPEVVVVKKKKKKLSKKKKVEVN